MAGKQKRAQNLIKRGDVEGIRRRNENMRRNREEADQLLSRITENIKQSDAAVAAASSSASSSPPLSHGKIMTVSYPTKNNGTVSKSITFGVANSWSSSLTSVATARKSVESATSGGTKRAATGSAVISLPVAMKKPKQHNTKAGRT